MRDWSDDMGVEELEWPAQRPIEHLWDEFSKRNKSQFLWQRFKT